MLTLYQAKNGLKVEGLSGSSVPEDDLTLVKTNLNYLTERVDAVEGEINNDIVKHSDFGDSDVQYPTKNYISVNYINKDEYREQMKTLATTTQVGVINDKVDECQNIINEAVSDISTINDKLTSTYVTYSVLSAYVTTNDLDESLNLYVSKTNLSEQLNDYALKNSDSLNVVHDDRTLKITGDIESNKFNVDIVTSPNTSLSTTTNIMQIGLGKVDFGYNQIRTQNLMLAGQSLQQIIRYDMSERPKSTDLSLYTSLMIDNNFYNKTEIDTKISEIDLSGYVSNSDLSTQLDNYYTKTENNEIFLKTDELGNELKDKLCTLFKSEMNFYGFNIYFDTSTINTIKTRSDIEIISETGGKTVKFTNCTPVDTNGNPYITNGYLDNYVSDTNLSEQLSNYALKSELPDTSNYLEKQSLEWNIDGVKAVLKLNSLSKESGTHLFLEDNYYDNDKGWYIQAFEDKLRFRLNEISWKAMIIEFSQNGITFKGDKLLGQSEADTKYALKTEIPEDIDLSGYVTNEDLTTTLSDYVNNTDLSSQLSKYALKTDIPTVPFNVVDNMIEPTKTLNFTLDNFETSREYVRFNNIIGQKIVKWLIKDNGFGGGDAILEFACDVENSVSTLMQFVDYKSVVRIPNLYKNETVKYLTNEDLTTTLSDYVSNTNLSTQLSNYALKSELPDTSNYYVKRPNIEFSYVVDYGDQMSFTFMNSTENVTIFSVNHNVLGKSLLFSHNQDKGVMISEIGQNILFGIQQNGALTFTQKLRHTNDMQSFVEYVTSTELQQSMTITHLAPIDEELDINSFVIGAPVYMTGKVYVKENNTWHKSTVNDSIDCIPSVKTNGTWKEYLGICTHILPETREIKFATHGDYLVKVDDSSTYGIGDTVYIEHVIRDNISIPVLKILSEDIPLTTKINRMTVGIVTSIIDSKTISVIKD